MKQNAEFQNVGKRMPYRVPENYMTALQEKVKANAAAEQARHKTTRKTRFRWVAAASFAAAVFAGVVALNRPAPTTSESLEETACQLYAQIPTAEQAVIDDCINDDIFLTLINSEL